MEKIDHQLFLNIKLHSPQHIQSAHVHVRGVASEGVLVVDGSEGEGMRWREESASVQCSAEKWRTW